MPEGRLADTSFTLAACLLPPGKLAGTKGLRGEREEEEEGKEEEEEEKVLGGVGMRERDVVGDIIATVVLTEAIRVVGGGESGLVVLMGVVEDHLVVVMGLFVVVVVVDEAIILPTVVDLIVVEDVKGGGRILTVSKLFVGTNPSARLSSS